MAWRGYPPCISWSSAILKGYVSVKCICFWSLNGPNLTVTCSFCKDISILKGLPPPEWGIVDNGNSQHCAAHVLGLSKFSLNCSHYNTSLTCTCVFHLLPQSPPSRRRPQRLTQLLTGCRFKALDQGSRRHPVQYISFLLRVLSRAVFFFIVLHWCQLKIREQYKLTNHIGENAI